MNKTFTWTYDAAGNLLTRNVYAFSTSSTGSSTETISYLYDEESGWNDLLTSYDGLEIAYDEIGNPTKIVDDFYSGSNGIWEEYGYEFVWSGRQLMGRRYYDNYCGDIWYDESMDMGFSYNADGIRTGKTVYETEYQYILNGTQIIGETWTEYETEHTLFYIYDESGSPLGIQYRTDAYGDGEFTYFFFEKNLQGDIVAVYNANGRKIGSYVYDAWGNFSITTTSTNTSLENSIVNSYNPFRYRGYYYDKDLGWYYLQTRYYNPQWGRFVNADGYVSTGTGLLGYNMFAYCNNNPVMNVDPTGNFPWLLFAVATLILTTFTSCAPIPNKASEDTGDPNSLIGSPLDPGPKTTAYDTYEEAIAAGIDEVYRMSEEENWEREAGAFVYLYQNGKYYIGKHGNGIGGATSVYIPLSVPNGTILATIHSHPCYQQEPFKEDWLSYKYDYHMKIESYIVERGDNGRLVRFLPVGAIDQTAWRIYQ